MIAGVADTHTALWYLSMTHTCPLLPAISSTKPPQRA
jgi:hypothetical protein